MKRLISPILIIIFLLLQVDVSAQDQNLLISSSYLRNIENEVMISSEVLDEDEEEPVDGISVKLFHINVGDTLELTSAISDEKGIIVFEAIDYAKLRHDENGYFHFLLTTDQTDQFLPFEELYKVRDILLELNLEIIDSVNTMGIRIQTWEEGELVGIEDEEIILYAQRLFSRLKIGETWTSKSGEDATDFPMDLPGGPNGEVEIIAALEEHGDFGTVFVSDNINWGVPISQNYNEKDRELWSMEAPVWMIVTFWVLMTGVWGHYFWMIWNLRNINKDRTAQSSDILYVD